MDGGRDDLRRELDLLEVPGALALENLQRFTFSLAFIGVSGFSELGISVGSLSEAAVKAAESQTLESRNQLGADRARAHS